MDSFNEILTQKLLDTKAQIAELQGREQALASLLATLTSTNGNGNGNGHPRREPGPDTQAARVLGVLRAKGRTRFDVLARRLDGMPLGTVGGCLSILKDKGFVQNPERGFWQAV